MKRIIMLPITIISLLVLIGCGQQPSEQVLAYQENNEIIGQDKDNMIGKISDTIYDSIDRSNTKAEEVMIGGIEREGEDIIPQEGRYTISGELSGRVLIYDEDGVPLLEEVLDQAFGVNSVTVDLNGSHTVYVDGLEQAFLVPAPTQPSHELTAGIWEVGKDIEAGTYSVMPASEFAFGDLHIFEKGESPRVFEFLNITPESKIDIQLKDGQKLKITGLAYLQFEPES